MNVSQFSGEKIREYRKKKGFNQEDIASRLNMSQSAYAKIENGKTSLDVDRLLLISEYLEVPINDLLPESRGQNVQFNNKDGYQVEHFYADGRELLKEKERYIQMLEKELEFLKSKLG